MKCLYEEKTGETVYSLFEEGETPKTYGISVKDRNDLSEIHDITTIYQKAYEIYETLVRNTVSPLQTGYIISDLIS